MENELKIRINGDIEGLKKATEDAGKQLDTLTSAQSRVRSGLQELNKTSLDYERQLSSLTKSYRDGGISQEKYAKESEKIQTSLSATRAGITDYQRELSRLNREVERAASAESRKSAATSKDTSSTSANTAATKANTVEVRKNESALVRHVYAQRAALSASNNLTRSFTAIATGSGNVASNLGVATRQAATLATTATGLQGGMAALASSLLGPGGVVIAISAGVTALTGYISSKMAAKRATEDGTSANRTYIETLEGIARASAEGEQAANRDLTSLRLLYEATQNLALPMEARLKAARELLDQYPRQFEGMTTEAILAGRAASAYNQLTASITATAMAAANLDRIRENSNKILNNRLEMLDKQAELNELNARIEAEEARSPVPGRRAGQAGEALDAADASRLNRLYEQRAKLNERINELGGASGKITDENTQLQREYNAQILKGADLSGNLNTQLEQAGKTTNKAIKEQRDQFAEQALRDENRLRVALEEGRNKELEQAEIRYENLQRLAEGNADKLKIAEDLYRRDIAAINAKWDEQEEEARVKAEERIQARTAKIAENAIKHRRQLKEAERKAEERAQKQLQARLEREQRRYARTLSNELSKSFEGFLTNGENIFKSLGDAFKRMIIRMIAEAAALKTIQFISGATGGGGGGNNVNWWALIGTAINIASKFIGSGGGGGSATASPISNAQISASGIASSFGNGGSPQVFIADTRLRGQDQIIQYNRAMRFNARFNGGQ